jgi:uncharacterized membrane protein
MTPMTDLPPNTETAGRAGRGLRWVLAVSVALNLAVVGLVAGAMLREGGPHGRMVRDLDFGPFTEALTEGDREALRRAFMARMPEMRDMRAAMRADFAALLAALRAEPFDAAALQGAVANQAGRMQRRLEVGQQIMLERIAAMTVTDRRAFADRLEARLRDGR